MSGIFTYISFLSIYYIVVVIIDIIGTIREYRKSIFSVENPASIKFQVDFNSDLAVFAVIYLISYYSGVFDG